MTTQIGERIRKRREELGLSQSELARRVGYVHCSSVNKIELDGRSLVQSKILAFAKALDVTPEYLMGWEDEMAEGSEPPKAEQAQVVIELMRGMDDRQLDRLLAYAQALHDMSGK